MKYCSGCGRPMDDAIHFECSRRQAATDPPRYCTACGRKLVVEVFPVGCRARCVKCG